MECAAAGWHLAPAINPMQKKTNIINDEMQAVPGAANEQSQSRDKVIKKNLPPILIYSPFGTKKN
jgi:hypothetical protein